MILAIFSFFSPLFVFLVSFIRTTSFVPDPELSPPAARACALLGGSARTWWPSLPMPLDGSVRALSCHCPSPHRPGANPISARWGPLVRVGVEISCYFHFYLTFALCERMKLFHFILFSTKQLLKLLEKLCQTRLYLKN